MREQIKVGDIVVVNKNNYQFLSKVVRETKTLFFVGDEKLQTPYLKSTLNRKGKGIWVIDYIKKPTREEIKQVKELMRRRMIVNKIVNFDFRTLSTEELESIYHILNR